MVRAFAILALGTVLVTAAWGNGSRPELRVVRDTPLTVAGSGFAAGERVRLTLRTGRARAFVRNAQAGSEGRFRTAFPLLVALDPCRGTIVVTATGSRGGTATWKRACRPPSTRPPRVSG